MFDVEKMSRECVGCDFCEEFTCFTNHTPCSVYKCRLKIYDRLEKCPLYLRDLERLNLPNYVALNKDAEETAEYYHGKYDNILSTHEKLKQEHHCVKSEKSKYKAKYEKYKKIVDEINKRLKPERALCKDIDHSRLVRDIDEILKK